MLVSAASRCRSSAPGSWIRMRWSLPGAMTGSLTPSASTRLRSTSIVRASASLMIPAISASISSSARPGSAACMSRRNCSWSICTVKLVPPARSSPRRTFSRGGETVTSENAVTAARISHFQIACLSMSNSPA